VPAIVQVRWGAVRVETNSSHVSPPGKPSSPICSQALRSALSRCSTGCLRKASSCIQLEIWLRQFARCRVSSFSARHVKTTAKTLGMSEATVRNRLRSSGRLLDRDLTS
jgi:hypothetical protein